MDPANNVLPQNKMASAPVGTLLLKMSLPLMLSMILEAFYNVVDSLFISHYSENALTALSLAFPIQLLIVSITVGTAVGINALLSRMLGEKDQQGVNSVAINGIFLALLTYVVFLLFGLFFTNAYFSSQTSDPEIRKLGVDYLSICLIFSFGAVGQITFQRLLQSTGKTTLSMVSQLVGAAVNIILDPILIFGMLGAPRMGVTGAALATVIGQAIALLIAVYFNLSKNKEIQFHLRGYRPDGKMIREIYRIGFPAIIMQSLNSVMSFGVNFILIPLSSTAVAAFGIYVKIMNFVFMPVYGLGNGVIAMTAFNYGAGSKKRIDSTIKAGMVYASVVMLLGTAVIELFSGNILMMFGASDELAEISITCLRVISLSYIFVAFTTISQGVCQALGNGVYSLVIALLRIVIVLLPVLYLFSLVFPLAQIWWAFMIAEITSAAVGVVLLRRIYKKKVAVTGGPA